jgi:PAS domain S-box-containing protein
VDEGVAACGAALLRGERVIVEDVSTSPVFAASLARDVVLAAGVKAVQSAPLIDRSGALIGMFSTHFRQPHRPDHRELRLLDLLAHQAVSFIERADFDRALQVKEQQLRHITDHVATMIAQCSRDLRYVFVNKARADFIGRPAERIIGQPIVEVLGGEAFAAIRPYVDRAVAGERVDFEAEIPYAGKPPRYMRCVYVPDVDSHGTIRGWIGAITDITERKRIEDALINVANEHRRAELQMADDLRAMTRLQALSIKLVQAGDLKPLLSEILSAAADLTGTDKGNIQLYDPATGRLRIVVHQGLGRRLVEHFAEQGWARNVRHGGSKDRSCHCRRCHPF